MSAPLSTAMVLAAGLGTRMRPLTDDRPKALVEVGGRALVDHMLDRLAEGGVTRAVVNLHAFADRLEAHLRARTAVYKVRPSLDLGGPGGKLHLRTRMRMPALGQWSAIQRRRVRDVVAARVWRLRVRCGAVCCGGVCFVGEC